MSDEPHDPRGRFAASLGRRTHNFWVIAAAIAPLVGGLAGSLARGLPPDLVPLQVVAAPILVVLGVLALAHAVLRKPLAEVRRTPVEASFDALRVADSVYSRADLTRGHVRFDTKWVLRIERSGLRSAIDLEVRDAAEGNAVLRALRLDALHSLASFRASSRVLGMPGLWSLGLLVSMVGAPLLLGSYGFAVAFLYAVASLWPSRVDVGADGVVLRWGWLRTVVPLRSIASAHVLTGADKNARRQVAVVITRYDEPPLKILFSWLSREKSTPDEVAARIQELAAAARSAAPLAATPEVALLARGGSDVATWTERLRALGAGALGSHRDATVRTDALWSIVGNRNGRPATRAAAAVALGPSLDVEGRARLAEHASATAEPHLRIALDATASEDEGALAEALGAMCDER